VCDQHAHVLLALLAAVCLVTLAKQCLQKASKQAAVDGDSTTNNSNSSSTAVLEVCHADIISDTYWLQHPHVLQLQSVAIAAATAATDAVVNGVDELSIADSDQQASTQTFAAAAAAAAAAV
jgi:hypothetical protein